MLRLLNRLAAGTRASSAKPRGVSPTVLSTDRPGVPYRRRAVNCRYGMCQAGARSDFRPGYERLQSAFQEQERGQKRRARMGYHHGDPTRMCCGPDSLSGHGPGRTLAISLNDGGDFSCGCFGDKICCFSGRRSCVLANVGMRHSRQVQGSNSGSN